MSEPVDPGAPPDAPAPGHVTLQIGQGDGPNPLDYLVILFVMAILGGVVFGLFTVKDVPQGSLPIIASLASAFIAVVSGYTGFRWGSSSGSKAANAALAKIAGAQ